MIRRGSLFLVLMFGFHFAQGSTLPHLDSQFGCIDQNTVRTYVSDFSIRTRTFTSDPNFCDNNSQMKKLLNVLEIVSGLQFSGNQTNVFIRNIISKNGYYKWLRDMTRSIRLDNNVPTAIAYNRGGHFTLQHNWLSLSTLGRLITLVHEARHTERYYHTRCKYGPYSNIRTPGCDTSLEQQGSHGVEMEFNARVALQGANVHPVFKSMARLATISRANFVFNKLPMRSIDTIIGLDENGTEVVAYNKRGLQVTPLKPVNQAEYLLKRTSFGASLLHQKTRKFLALDLYSGVNKDTLLPDTYSYYKTLNNLSLPGFIDAQEFDVGNLRVLVALDDKFNVYRLNYRNAQWKRIASIPNAYRLVTTAPDGTTGLFALSATTTNEWSSVHELDINSNKFTQLDLQWPAELKNVVFFDSRPLYLMWGNGQLLGSNGQPYSPLASERFNQIVTGPLYDVYDLHL